MERKKRPEFREIRIKADSPVTSSIYPGNKLNLSRYSLLTFIPVNLFEQFQRISNIWFLIVSIFQLIPYSLNPTQSWTTIAPLAFLLSISLAKDAYTQYLLSKKIEKINHFSYSCWDGEKFVTIKSKDILVGQFIKIKENQTIPADIVLIATDNQKSVYLDMTRLVGVASLKEKQPIHKLSSIISSVDTDFSAFAKLGWIIKVPEPNSDYSSFYGEMKPDNSPSAYEMFTSNLLFSGGVLKSTGDVVGIVVYCGEESRLQLNTDPYRSKYSRIEQSINLWVVFLLIFLILFVIGSVLGYYYFNNYSLSQYEVLEPIITFILLYNNIVPISLFMVIDIIRLIQNTIYTYQNPGVSFNTDVVNENLGQIDYLITDKTATLTEKKLQVVAFIADDKIFELKNEPSENTNPDTEKLLNLSPQRINVVPNFTFFKEYLSREKLDTVAHTFMKCMALCNRLYQNGSEFLGSHEEIAMVEAADFLGYSLNKPSENIYDLQNGQNFLSYKLISFKSTNKLKRSRFLLEDLQGSGGYLFVKGTPESVSPLLNISTNQVEEMKTSLADFREKGYRCLVLAYKRLSYQQILENKSKVKKIKESLISNETSIENLFKTLEKDIKYLGVVAISEKLHAGTTETLKKLQQAGIKIWMTSSDSTENSLNVAKEAKIISSEYPSFELVQIRNELDCTKALIKGVKRMIFERKDSEGVLRPSISDVNARDTHYLKNANEENIEDSVTEDRNEYLNEGPDIRNKLIFRKMTKIDFRITDLLKKPFEVDAIEYSLVIDRTTFKIALNDEDCRKLLVCLLVCAKSVVFTELMPRDKGNVVKLLKENVKFNPVVASVGTGEGDISILQISDIGIGIDNNEESLAMNYSDITISNFSQINKLILVQGHYNYSRLSTVILLFLYKNWFLTIVLLGYTFLSSYSGTSIFNSSLLIGFNIFFTTMPIIVIGIFDEDASSTKILKSPQIYMLGIKNSLFNTNKLIRYLALGSIQGVLLILLCYTCLPMVIDKDGQGGDFIMLGVFTYITLIVAVLIQIYVETYCYTVIYYASVLFSIVFLIIFLSIESNTTFPDPELIGVGIQLTRSAFSLISITFSSMVCVIPIYFIYTYTELFSPKMLEKLKSNHSLEHYEVCKYETYSDSLGSLYKHSANWKNKIENQKFSINKFSMKFNLPHIERKYADNFIADHILMFKFTLTLLWVLLILWTIFGATFLSVTLNYTLARIVLLSVCSIFLFFLWTDHFLRHYISYTCGGIFILLLAKFGLEAGFSQTSLLVTSLISAITFLVFNIHWVNICILNILNVVLFVISISMEYSQLYPSTTASLNILSSVILEISITLTSAFVGYYCESSRRKEHELLIKEKNGIETTQSILKIMLPEFVRNRVVNGARYIAENQGELTIVFCDIGDFEKICNDYDHKELTSFLDKIFRIFDRLCEVYGVTKIETVGKTYMACAGLKDSDKDLTLRLRKLSHAHRAVEFAVAILQEAQEITLKNGNEFKVKIGINTGLVSAGVVGHHKPQFSLVGDTVNTASRMCSTLKNYNSLQVSQSTYDLIKESTNYEFKADKVFAKGKGDIDVYVLVQPKNENLDVGVGRHSLSNVIEKEYSVGSEKSIIDGFSNTPKRENSRTSRTWKEEYMKKSHTDLIKYSPSIHCCFYKSNKKEKQFTDKQFEKMHSSAGVSLIIALVTFTLLWLLTVLQYFFTSVYSNASTVIGRSAIVGLFLGLVFLMKALQKNYYYFILPYSVILIEYIVSLINIYNSSHIPPDLVGLEIMYIILLICQSVPTSIFPKVIVNVSLFVPWIILGASSQYASIHLTNAILAAGFLLINLRAIYSQEKSDRMNFNLSILADSEIQENETLLSYLMPTNALAHLEKGQSFTERHQQITMIFADIVGFTDWSSHKSPNDIILMLSNLFTRFDKLCVEYGVYKVHTIGDCYVVMGYTGTKNRNPSQECINSMKMAYKMIEVIKEENQKHGSNLNMRIGLHTGEVIAGIVGTNIVRYDIWGPDVLIANKMESNGEKGRVKISMQTKNFIEGRIEKGIEFEPSATVSVADIGATVQTFFANCSDLNAIVFKD